MFSVLDNAIALYFCKSFFLHCLEFFYPKGVVRCFGDICDVVKTPNIYFALCQTRQVFF